MALMSNRIRLGGKDGILSRLGGGLDAAPTEPKGNVMALPLVRDVNKLVNRIKDARARIADEDRRRGELERRGQRYEAAIIRRLEANATKRDTLVNVLTNLQAEMAVINDECGLDTTVKVTAIQYIEEAKPDE